MALWQTWSCSAYITGKTRLVMLAFAGGSSCKPVLGYVAIFILQPSQKKYRGIGW
jgi:hypothetical protein